MINSTVENETKQQQEIENNNSNNNNNNNVKTDNKQLISAVDLIEFINSKFLDVFNVANVTTVLERTSTAVDESLNFIFNKAFLSEDKEVVVQILEQRIKGVLYSFMNLNISENEFMALLMLISSTENRLRKHDYEPQLSTKLLNMDHIDDPI
eukprot:Pgem_evm1s6216